MTTVNRLTTAKVIKRESQWYIIGLLCGECGPYDDKDVAREDALGLERTYKHCDEPGFITCEDSRLRSKRR